MVNPASKETQPRPTVSSNCEPSPQVGTVSSDSHPQRVHPKEGLAPITQPALQLASGVAARAIYSSLTGWNEGEVSHAEWMDTGGPLDATDHLPYGAAWAHHCAATFVLGASVQRPGALG